jgi:hypothetical protein
MAEYFVLQDQTAELNLNVKLEKKQEKNKLRSKYVKNGLT